MQPRPLNIFVSSTWRDLQPERRAVEAALQRLRSNAAYAGMEHFGSRDESTERASLDEVERSHIYIGIFAGRYGSGITEAEYRRARALSIPCLIYFKSESSITLNNSEREPDRIARLDALKAELRASHTVTEFDTPHDLAAKVTADLLRPLLDDHQQPKEPPAPPASTFSALHQLPPPPGDFIGRTEELADLTANIAGGVQISGMQGQGGIGKTALALKLAQQLAPLYPDAQFYLDLKGADRQHALSPSDALAHVIRAYHPTAKLPDNQTELESLYRSLLHDKRALLLMDNARDAAQVTPIIPPQGCVLLVTSRRHFTLPNLYAKNLDTLPPHDARQLLLRIAPRIGDDADAIATLCGHLPLALRLAASALAERVDLSVPDYLRRLSDTNQRLRLLNDVAAALQLSYELLTPELQKLWRTLAVFPDTFDALAAEAVWAINDPDTAQDALSDLLKYSLLDWDAASARYSLHDLARLFAHQLLAAHEGELHQAQLRHAKHYQGVVAAADYLYLSGGDSLMHGLALFEREWTNIQVGQSWAEKNATADRRALELCNEYPAYGFYIASLRLHPRQRISWLKVGLKAARELNNKQCEGWHSGNLGLAYDAIGESPQALEFYQRSLDIARELGDRRDEANALGTLGGSYASLGDPQRGIECYEQALLINREIGNRRGEGLVLLSLGATYAELNDTALAIEFYEQALLIAREVGNRRAEGAVLGNLGNAYANLDNLQLALEFYEQRLPLAREIGDRYGEGNTLWNMSLVFAQLGDLAHAIDHAEASLKIREEIEDPRAAKVREALDEWREQS